MRDRAKVAHCGLSFTLISVRCTHAHTHKHTHHKKKRDDCGRRESKTRATSKRIRLLTRERGGGREVTKSIHVYTYTTYVFLCTVSPRGSSLLVQTCYLLTGTKVHAYYYKGTCLSLSLSLVCLCLCLLSLSLSVFLSHSTMTPFSFSFSVSFSLSLGLALRSIHGGHACQLLKTV